MVREHRQKGGGDLEAAGPEGNMNRIVSDENIFGRKCSNGRRDNIFAHNNVRSSPQKIPLLLRTTKNVVSVVGKTTW